MTDGPEEAAQMRGGSRKVITRTGGAESAALVEDNGFDDGRWGTNGGLFGFFKPAMPGF